MNYKRLQPNLIHLSVVDSTSNYAANLLKETNVVNGTTILTKSQTQGRGQRGNEWQTEKGKNLILSTIIFPQLKNEFVFYLNIVVSLALNKTINDLGITSEIKWPNDIYVNDKKVAGILIENQLHGQQINSAILGIGLNVNQIDFPEDIRATSLQLIKGEEVEIDMVFDQYFSYLDFYLDHLMQGNFPLLLSRYYDAMYRFQEKALYKDESGEFEGVITGIDANGRLLIRVMERVRSYDLKEVEFIL